VAPTGINVRPTHLYRTEPPPDINVRYLYRVGWRRPRRAPTKGHLYPVVAPTGTDAPICTGGKILDTNEKSGQGQMPDSLVVIVPHMVLQHYIGRSTFSHIKVVP
jgi:hypothetical protein